MKKAPQINSEGLSAPPEGDRMGGRPVLIWLDDPEDHDWSAAEDYLTLLYPLRLVRPVLDALRERWTARTCRKAKDILRASGLALLPRDNEHVYKDRHKIKQGTPLSPILLVRDRGRLHIADGYHRVCACYHLGEDTDIPCVIGDLP